MPELLASRDAVVVAHVGGPADIHGVHGTTGLTHWKCLASGADLRSDWEAVEWASIPPGGVSGEHLHTRTEEIYFILSGRGEIFLDGTAHPVRPGTLVLTGLGTVHGLRNTGGTHLDWLVVEMRSPQFAAALSAASPPPPSPGIPACDATSDSPSASAKESHVRARIHDLRAEGSVDPVGVFTGPLRRIAVESLPSSATTRLTADGREHMVFVLSGSGWAESGGATVELSPGSAVTLPLATEARIGADREGVLEYFHAEIEVLAPEFAR